MPIKAGTPMTAKALKMFEPRTFPTAISTLPFHAAVTLTANSGRDVPKATALKAMVSDAILSS